MRILVITSYYPPSRLGWGYMQLCEEVTDRLAGIQRYSAAEPVAMHASLFKFESIPVSNALNRLGYQAARKAGVGIQLHENFLDLIDRQPGIKTFIQGCFQFFQVAIRGKSRNGDGTLLFGA